MSIEHLKPVIRLSIANHRSGATSLFGPGIAALCSGVQSTGSLNAAAKDMGMAYSKAWRIIKETESSLGVELLVRDGAHGSTLTDDCIRLLESYEALQTALEEQGEVLFQELCAHQGK